MTIDWDTYLEYISAADRMMVDGLLKGKALSPAEIKALKTVFETRYETLSFPEAGRKINKATSTIKTQFDNIYSKFGITPASLQELEKLLCIGFDKRLEEERQQQQIDRPTTPTSTPTPQIKWIHRCTELLADRQSTVTKALGLESRSLSDVHVPLGLIERKQQPKVDREPDPAMGSQLYQQPELKEVKRFEHQAFLDDVVRDRSCGKHIAIIGEPGAGKTTLLAKIGEWLIANPGNAEIVAWISLADLQKQDLSDYFYGTWLKSVHPSDNPPPDWRSQLEQLIQDRKVWLLLDGLDEMAAGDLLRWIDNQLNGWGNNLRVVLTCRLNLWDGGFNLAADRFEVFRTLDYDYVPEDRVKEFIDKWFTSEPDVDRAAGEQTAKALRAALDEPGKERIKDLVKNPLRLTLLCASWKDGQGLPDTQATLYQQFVNWFDRSNESKSSEKVAQQDKRDRHERDRNLGKLAKLGLNRAEGLGRRFRFTEREMQDLWQDRLTTLNAVKRLGWLNCIGVDETGNKVYAFFHPTFQEYFAACSIEDWDYFLPRAHEDRPVPCQSENVPTYRVFEQEWRQTILLWIGRENVRDELKKEFLKNLDTFNDGLGYHLLNSVYDRGRYHQFYFDKTKYLFLIFNNELADRMINKSIDISIEYHVQEELIAFKDRDKNEIDLLRLLDTLSNDILNESIISDAVQILSHHNFLDSNRIVYFDEKVHIAKILAESVKTDSHLSDVLKTVISEHLDKKELVNEIKIVLSVSLLVIDPTPKNVLDTLHQLSISSTDFHDKLHIARILFDLNIDRYKAIDIIVDILQVSQPDKVISILFNPIIDMCNGERKVIDAILYVIKNGKCSKNSLLNYMRILPYIAKKDLESINLLIKLLTSTENDIDIKDCAIRVLGSIGSENLEAKCLLHKFMNDVDEEIAIISARVLCSWVGYTEFYHARNATLPIIPTNI